MKSIFTFIILFAFGSGFAQVTNEGLPKSWDLKNSAEVAPIVMTGFDLAATEREDAVNDLKRDRPYRFGYQYLVDYNLENSGKWETLANGDRIWRIRFYSEGAKTMNFLLSDYYMPEGATLYLYNNDRTDLLGAYDSSENNERRILGTWLIKGQDIWLEYYEPKAVANRGKLEIFKVIHGYRTAEDFSKSTQDIGDSDPCEYDVDCTMGTIDAQKNISKKSVAMMIVDGSGFCTGALINNVNNDKIPYFLTANHCYETPGTPGENDPGFWAFRFDWRSPSPVCAANANSPTGPFHQTNATSGATLKARRAQTDFMLVEINSLIPNSWGVVWAGWTRSTTPPAYTFGIHHPAGDIMKVSIDNNSPTSTTADGMSVWQVNQWDKGVTEPGSSGSPLFDPQGRIIGQLYGGTSFCNGLVPNNGSDIYGRFNISWNAGLSASSRLKEWLDPDGTNATSVDTFNGVVGVEEVVLNNEISVYPNPSNGVFTVAMDNMPTLKYEVYNMLGQSVQTGELTAANATINLGSGQNGIYILKLIDEASNSTVTRKIVKE